MRICDWSSDVCSSDLAIIEAVAGRVAIVEHQRGLDRNIGIRPRETAAQLGAERVAELVVDRPRKLIEFGLAFAMIALGTDVDIVEIGGNDAVVAVAHIVGDVDLIFFAPQQQIGRASWWESEGQSV